MILRQIDIERFGIWRDWSSGELPPGLVVFYGPNETGKSTLLEFLRGIFFGFAPRHSFAYEKEGLAGRVLCLQGDNLYSVQRAWSADYGERCHCLNLASGQAAEHILHELCPVEETLFSSIFAINLEDIAQLRTLEGNAAGQLLYELSLGVDRARLMSAFARLRTAVQQWEDRQQAQPWEGERQQLLRDLEDTSAEIPQLAELIAQQRELTRLIGTLQQKEAQIEKACQQEEMLRPLLPLWSEFLALEQKLREFADLVDLPAELFQRGFHLQKRLRKLRQRLASLRQKKAELRTALRALQVNGQVLSFATELEGLRGARHDMEEAEAALQTLQQELARCEDEWHALRKALQQFNPLTPASSPGGEGEGVNVEQPGPFPELNWQEIRQTARRWQRYLQEEQAVAEELRAIAEQREDLQHRLNQQLQALGATSVTAALDVRSQHASQLRRRQQLTEQLASITQRENELRSQRLELMKEALLPRKTWVFVGAPFVLGLALIVLAFLTAALFSSATGLGWFAIVIGSLLVVTGVVGKFYAEYLHQQKWLNLQQDWESLRRDRQQIQEQLSAVEARLAENGKNLPQDLEHIEGQIRELEKLGLWQTQCQQWEERIGNLQLRQQTLSRKIEELSDAVIQACTRCGLPLPATPQQALDLFNLARQWQRLSQRRSALHKREAALREKRSLWLSRLHQIAQASGLAMQGETPSELLSRLLEAYERSADSARQRRQLRRSLQRLERAFQLARDRADKLRRRWRQIKGQMPVASTNSATLRSLHARWQEAQALRQQYEQLERALKQALTDLGRADVTPRECGELFGRLEEHLASLQQQRAALKQQIQEAEKRQESLAAQLQRLLADRRAERTRLALTAFDEQRARQLRHARVLRIALLLMERIREKFEHQRQPRILQRASAFLPLLTEGRYRRLWTPIAERVLLAEEESGTQRRCEELSRGTREQIFLALRLALVADWADRGIKLPLILDDVLVNFDHQRVRAACRALAEFARQSHQLILLTCHQHIAEICEEIGVAVRELIPAEGTRPRRASLPPADFGGNHVSLLPENVTTNTAPADDAAQVSATPASRPPDQQPLEGKAEAPLKPRRSRKKESTQITLPTEEAHPRLATPEFSSGPHGELKTSPGAGPLGEENESWLFVPDPYPLELAGTSNRPSSLAPSEAPDSVVPSHASMRAA